MDPKQEDRKRREEGRLEIIKARNDKSQRRRTSSVDESHVVPPAEETAPTGKKVIDISSTNWKSIVADGREQRKSVGAKTKVLEPVSDFFLSFDSAPQPKVEAKKEEPAKQRV